MKKQLIIGSLILLPSALCAMDWTPYHNIASIESMRDRLVQQRDDEIFRQKMETLQIAAANEAALEMAAYEQAAQQSAQQPVSSAPAQEVPRKVIQVHSQLIGRYYADRTEWEHSTGLITIDKAESHEARYPGGMAQIWYHGGANGRVGPSEVLRYSKDGHCEVVTRYDKNGCVVKD